jgi:SAM-dependent methyltransferase
MKILDPTCGSRMFWFDKHEPHTTYTDIRKEMLETKDRGKSRKIVINPDKVADFTNLPYRDYEFNLIVFDPPHLNRVGQTSWLAKKYGHLDKDTWPALLEKGFRELWRVLALDGVLLFKWSDNQISFKDVLNLFDHAPILGDKRGHTRWFVFIKPNENQASEPSLLDDQVLNERGLKK